MKHLEALNLRLFWTQVISDIIAFNFTDTNQAGSLETQSPETPAFMRKAFGIKLRLKIETHI